MFDWFGKRNATANVRFPHHTVESARSVVPGPAASASEFRDAREMAYAALFGGTESVAQDTGDGAPAISVYTFRRTGRDGRELCTLVTGGMSDFAMLTPSKSGAAKRVELIFYCSGPHEEYDQTLRWLGRFPHEARTWLGPGHSIPNGYPPRPMWGSESLNSVLLMPPIVSRDKTLPDLLKLDGDPVHFLWVVPLTSAECRLKVEKGYDAILELFEKHRHPHVFDPERRSYI